MTIFQIVYLCGVLTNELLIYFVKYVEIDFLNSKRSYN